MTSVVFNWMNLLQICQNLSQECDDYVCVREQSSSALTVRTENSNVFYVYWTVHHLDRWIKRDQLDVTCFIISLFNAQHVSNVSTSILRSLRFICWVISCVVLLWYDVCWCYGAVRLVSGCRLKHCFSLHPDTTPPQPNHNVTPTHIVPEQYNPWNKFTISRKLLRMDVLTFETCWAVKFICHGGLAPGFCGPRHPAVNSVCD